MLRLLLLRHAKSSWAGADVTDRDRPLAPRGQRAAERMASIIAGADFLPDRLICSPARRTRETLAPLLPHLTDATQVSIVDELYDSGAGPYNNAIISHGGNARRLLVLGHNPATHLTAVSMIGAADEQTARRLAAKFPTAALAVIDFDCDSWDKIAPKSGRLTAFICPRDLDDDDTVPRTD